MKRHISPRNLGRAIGVSESSIKRWADEGRIEFSRTAGGHRRIALPEAIRFIRASRSMVLRPDLLGIANLTRSSTNEAPATGDFQAFLQGGMAEEARGWLMSRYLRGDNLGALFDGPLREAMERIGERWHREEDGVLVEHRAMDICIQAITQLRLALPEPTGAVALGGGAPGDIYLLPSLLVSTLLAAHGYRVVNLGPNTPLATFDQAVDHYDPSLVWVSVSVAPRPDQLSRDLESFLGAVSRTSAQVVLGGRARASLELPRMSHVVEADSLTELEAFVLGLRKSADRAARAG